MGNIWCRKRRRTRTLFSYEDYILLAAFPKSTRITDKNPSNVIDELCKTDLKTGLCEVLKNIIQQEFDKLVCNYNQKALLELPTETDLQRLYAIDDDSNFDSFKFWYKRTVITFAEQKPLFTKNHAPKSLIHTKILIFEDSIVQYWIDLWISFVWLWTYFDINLSERLKFDKNVSF